MTAKGQWKKVGKIQMQKHQRKQRFIGWITSKLQRRQVDELTNREKTAEEIERQKDIQEE